MAAKASEPFARPPSIERIDVLDLLALLT